MSEKIRLVMSQVLQVEPGEITQESSPESIERLGFAEAYAADYGAGR